MASFEALSLSTKPLGPGAKSSKVVHFSTVHPANDTRVFHKECRSLSASGYDVTLYARCAADAVIDGVTIKRVDEYTGRFSRMVVEPFRLVRRLLNERADLYHFHDPELLPVGILLRVLRKRVVYDAHEWVRGDVGSKPYLPIPVAKVLGFIAWAMEQVGGRVLSHVVTATPFIASQFSAHRVTVIRNYPDLVELDNGPAVPWPDREEAAVYLGGLNDERCGRELLDAAALLAGSTSKLIVAGPVDDGVDPRDAPAVDYLGVIDRPQVAVLLGRVRCGVVLLRDLTKFRDAMPIKFFEYLASGLPVLVSGSAQLIARLTVDLDCGLVVDEENPQQIAEAIALLVKADGDAEAMGRRGRAAVIAELNWSTESVRLLQLYDRLLS